MFWYPLTLSRIFGLAPLIYLCLCVTGLSESFLPDWTKSEQFANVTDGQASIARQIYFGLLICAACAALIWIETLRIGGAAMLGQLPRSLWIQFRARRVQTLIAVMVGSGLMTWYIARSDRLPNPYFIHVQVVIVAAAFLVSLRPPVAIALLGSRRESAMVLNEASLSLFPARVVALVDSQRTGPTMNFGRDDNLRTGSGQGWQDVVRFLQRSVAVIVVDGRFPSPVVQQELRWILQSADLMQRTVLIVPDEGESCLLEGVMEQDEAIERGMKCVTWESARTAMSVALAVYPARRKRIGE